MTRTCLLAAALALTACGDNALLRDVACEAQADAWCALVAHGASGCRVVYNHWCNDGAGGTVDGADQDACLDAIATLPPTPPPFGYSVPEACVATWSAVEIVAARAW